MREYGVEVVHRLALLLFTLLTLFFLFRDGEVLVEQLRSLGDRLIGLRGERIAGHMIAAVHGTVNGLVLVGLAEGLLLGIVYFAAGLPYPATVGAITAVAAVIPFVAPIVYTLAGLYLFIMGDTVGALIIIVSGSVIVFLPTFRPPRVDRRRGAIAVSVGAARDTRRSGEFRLSRIVSRSGDHGRADRAVARMDRNPGRRTDPGGAGPPDCRPTRPQELNRTRAARRRRGETRA